MNKQLLILFLIFFSFFLSAQRGVKIGYIDMEYILEKAPTYVESKNQLELRAQKWKQEIELKKNNISKLSALLLSEKVLLTKELIEEKETEIKVFEKELSEFQEKKFGTLGELIVQKTLLVQPIQDQVFSIIQDIAEAKKYDFIFDKSSDLTMLFAVKRFDISELVIRKLNAVDKGEKRTKKQQKADDEKEKLQDKIDENPQLAEREKSLAQTREARQKLIDDKKIEYDLRKKEAAVNRQKIIDERASTKNNNASPNVKQDIKSDETNQNSSKKNNLINEEKVNLNQNLVNRQLLRAKELVERKRRLEDKKLKELSEREALKKAKEEEKNKIIIK